MNNLFERVGPFYCTYTLNGQRETKITFEFNTWINMPVWFNRLIGRRVAYHCELVAWWRRLIEYGTFTEHCAFVIWCMTLVKLIVPAMEW